MKQRSSYLKVYYVALNVSKYAAKQTNIWKYSSQGNSIQTNNIQANLVSETDWLKSYRLRHQSNKGCKDQDRYNQVPHLTQDTNGKVTNSQLDTTNESQEVSLFPAADHKAHINRRAQRHSKHKTEKT